jgi:alpha-glucosidase
MDELATYARSKNVGLILWVTWTSIDKQFDALLPNLKKWDVKGLKIDFMQRDDQPAVNYYWKMAEKAAANRLTLDFHGAHKPAGLHRTWPNVLSFEGVYGLEQSKWDKDKRIDPEHNVTLPFIRMVAGPMDYTPGAMLNYQRDDWSPAFNRPASLGTRCHELAKYVVFESPLQMLADSPSNYRKEPECLRFLAHVPATWEKTVALDGSVGDYVAVARLGSDNLWYIGAMTDWDARRLFLKLDFLPAGDFEMEFYEDGINANRNAQDFRRDVKRVKNSDQLKIDLAPGGGFVAVLRQLK